MLTPYIPSYYLPSRTICSIYIFHQQDTTYNQSSLLTMLETALSLDRGVSAARNTAVILVLTAVCDVQSRVFSLSTISFTGFGTVMSVSLGFTAAHGVGLRALLAGYLVTVSL